ncbi:hypothetical protein GCM10020000_77140 [Streptomyces olivoverticillatus]
MQLYSALSRRSWGMGDLGDLAELAAWSGRTLEAGFVLVNPLHTMLPAATAGHSPYWPSSRCYPDPVHLRVEAVPEFPYLDGADRSRAQELVKAGEVLREQVLGEGALIDRDAVWTIKREALALVHHVQRGPGRQAAYDHFARREGHRLVDFATFCALAEHHGPDWRAWPEALRDARGAAVEQARSEMAAEVEFHQWLAWQIDEQMQTAHSAAKNAGMSLGIMHDLAVGAHPGGADTWMFHDCFAPDITVGAPPDAFTAQGQDWQQPPWRPDRLAAAGYAPFAQLLRGVMRHAGAVRMDHVLGLFRLWWVPRGNPLSEGAYVRYDHEAMLAVLALEAHRAGAHVIGEDLGTVEDGVREQLADRGVLGTSVLWFEQDADGRPLAAEHWRTACLATLTTHDLPSTAARLIGSDLELRHRLGMLTGPLEEERRAAASEVAAWQEELERVGLRTADQEGPPDAEALHAYLALTPRPSAGRVAAGHRGRRAGTEPARHPRPAPQLAARHRRRRRQARLAGTTGGRTRHRAADQGPARHPARPDDTSRPQQLLRAAEHPPRPGHRQVTRPPSGSGRPAASPAGPLGGRRARVRTGEAADGLAPTGGRGGGFPPVPGQERGHVHRLGGRVRQAPGAAALADRCPDRQWGLGAARRIGRRRGGYGRPQGAEALRAQSGAAVPGQPARGAPRVAGQPGVCVRFVGEQDDRLPDPVGERLREQRVVLLEGAVDGEAGGGLARGCRGSARSGGSRTGPWRWGRPRRPWPRPGR